MCVTDYFVRASASLLHLEGATDRSSLDWEAELRYLIHQIQRSDGALGTYRVEIATSSPDRFNMLTLCFPYQIYDCEGVDGAALPTITLMSCFR